MKIEYIGTNNVTFNYVFNNSNETPQWLIEFVTTIYTYPRMALGHFRLQIWWFEAELWEKIGFSMEKQLAENVYLIIDY